ncbi:MAG: CBU_0592 family membrane protein [Candidatus Binatia bacterium]
MSLADSIGSVGVALLLLAFGLNVFGFLSRESRLYQALNLAGAAIAGYASWLIDFVPFVVLEAIWSAVALATLVRPAGAGRA